MRTLEELFTPYVRALHVYAQRICPVTASDLNVRTAVVIEQSDGHVLLALSPEGWAERGEEILGRFPVDVVVTNAPTEAGSASSERELREAA